MYVCMLYVMYLLSDSAKGWLGFLLFSSETGQRTHKAGENITIATVSMYVHVCACMCIHV